MAEGQMNQFLNIIFSDMPAMRPIGWKRQYEMLETFAVSWLPEKYKELQNTVLVPKGFIHNGPSIPDRLRGIVFYTHRLLRASIIHDYLYSGWGSAHGWARKDADRLFLKSRKVEGGSLIRRRVMWLAVRMAVLYLLAGGSARNDESAA